MKLLGLHTDTFGLHGIIKDAVEDVIQESKTQFKGLKQDTLLEVTYSSKSTFNIQASPPSSKLLKVI